MSRIRIAEILLSACAIIVALIIFGGGVTASEIEPSTSVSAGCAAVDEARLAHHDAMMARHDPTLTGPEVATAQAALDAAEMLLDHLDQPALSC